MIGDRIKQARKLRRFSQRELGSRAGVSAQAISFYERNEDVPSSSVLLRLSEALQVQLEFFFRATSVTLGQPVHRDCKLDKATLAEMEASVIDKVERYVETEALFAEAGPKWDYPPSFPRLVSNNDEIEDAADSVRSEWALGLDPIENLTELLEEHGIAVIHEDEQKDFEACTYPDGNVRVIVVNSTKPGDRSRFTLAHELAHLLLQFPEKWRKPTRERAAHRFAGALLVPQAAAKRELGERRTALSVRELYDLKHKYGMSMQAWIHRANDLSIISDAVKSALFELFERNNWRKLEPGEQYPAERSTRQERLVLRAYLDGRISEGRARELLAESPAEFEERIGSIPAEGIAAGVGAN